MLLYFIFHIFIFFNTFPCIIKDVMAQRKKSGLGARKPTILVSAGLIKLRYLSEFDTQDFMSQMETLMK